MSLFHVCKGFDQRVDAQTGGRFTFAADYCHLWPIFTRMSAVPQHRAILQCCAEGDRNGACGPELAASLAHHQVVLQALREYLIRHYQTDLHPWEGSRSGFYKSCHKLSFRRRGV